MKIVEQNKVVEAAIKKMVTNPVAVGTSQGAVVLVDDKTSYDLGSSVNALAAANQEICAGCYDGRVLLKRANEEFQELYVHSGNVCSVDYDGAHVLTGSWDHSAILYRVDESAGSDGSAGQKQSNKQTARQSADDRSQLHPSDSSDQLRLSENTVAGHSQQTEILNGIIKNVINLSKTDSSARKKTFSHPESVWCVRLLPGSKMVTGCADGIIRIFENYSIMKEIRLHVAPVRGLLCEDGVFYSVDNHGNVHKTGPDGRLTRSRSLKELMFTMCRYQDKIVVAGEAGRVFLMNEELEVLDKLVLNCTTVWDANQIGDVLCLAGSNGTIYRVREDQQESKTEEQVPVKEEPKRDYNNDISTDESEMLKKAIDPDSVRSSEGKEEDAEQQLPEAAMMNHPKDGIFTSGGVKYKVEEGKIYIEKPAGWELIGDTVGSQDYSFPVTLDDKEYTLSFNKSDNVHDVASKFIRENKLDPQFHKDIVDHIQKNYKVSTLYKKYETLDILGIRKLLGDHPIIELVQRVKDGESFSLLKKDPVNIYSIEQMLLGGLSADRESERIPLFIVLDICKFLTAKGLSMDLSFLFTQKIATAKEAKALAFLLTNMVESPPFRLDFFEQRVKRLRDERLLTDDDVHKYHENLAVRNRK